MRWRQWVRSWMPVFIPGIALVVSGIAVLLTARMVAIIEKEAMLRTRPYVGVNKVEKVKDKDDNLIGFEFELINSGTLPAVVLRCSLKCFVGDDVKLNIVHDAERFVIWPGHKILLGRGKTQDCFLQAFRKR